MRADSICQMIKIIHRKCPNFHHSKLFNLATGSVLECEPNESACEVEVRTRLNHATLDYDEIGVITGCKQRLACQNNQKQNFVGKNKEQIERYM